MLLPRGPPLLPPPTRRQPLIPSKERHGKEKKENAGKKASKALSESILEQAIVLSPEWIDLSSVKGAPPYRNSEHRHFASPWRRHLHVPPLSLSLIHPRGCLKLAHTNLLGEHRPWSHRDALAQLVFSYFVSLPATPVSSGLSTSYNTRQVQVLKPAWVLLGSHQMQSPVFEPASNLLDGLRIVTDSVRYLETDSDCSSSESKRSSPSPSLSRRRSVTSMTGLMPLALAPSFSASTTHLPITDSLETKPDDCFPEMLARDLELHTDVFAAQRMTAGVPASVVTAEYMFRQKMTRSLSCRPRASSPYHTASARIRLLGAIEEKDSAPASLGDEGPTAMIAEASDVDSFTSSDESGGMPPPSFRYRNQSVATAATSLDSVSWKPSPRASPEPVPAPECSWIDCGSDDEDDEPDHLSTQDDYFEPLSPLSPRPPSFPEQKLEGFRSSLPPQQRPRWVHHKSHSVSGGSPLHTPRRRDSAQSMGESFQAKPLGTQFHVEEKSQLRHLSRALSPMRQSYRTHQPDAASDMPHKRRSVMQGLVIQTDILSEHDAQSRSYPDELEDMPTAAHSAAPLSRENLLSRRPSIPPSPPPSVQSWLNNSVVSYPASIYAADDMAKIVPLPPDVIETLRVSTACFPETMLLSSSLTIETIRTYSKKVRQPSAKMFEVSPPTSPEVTSRKSLWRKVVQRRPSGQSISSSSTLKSMSVLSIEAIKPWAHFKNVFAGCSDYICDAIYAHILAYNYISALASKLPPAENANPNVYRKPSLSRSDSQKEDIPKKAASLLGLASPADELPGRVGKLTKKLGSQIMPWAREDLSPHSTMSQSQENVIRGIQAELYRCTARLVATAKLASTGGAGEDKILDISAGEADSFLVRSLCEMVRMTEDSN